MIMRFLLSALMLALSGVLVASFAAPETILPAAGAHWFPAEVGKGAEIVDGLFLEINVVLVVLIALTLPVLAWVIWRGAGRKAGEGSDSAGHRGLEILWTAVPALVLGALTWSQLSARDAIAAEAAPPGAAPLVVQVIGAQFDWRFRYAGADGIFGTLDDIESVVDMPVPIGVPIEALLMSDDVTHSFFVPALRLKRDLVPGTTMPLRFVIDADDMLKANDPEELELRCAELCGWGHTAMVGRLLPLTPDAFDAWLVRMGEQRFAGDDDPGVDVDVDAGEDEAEDER